MNIKNAISSKAIIKSKNIELNKATNTKIKGNSKASVKRIGRFSTRLPLIFNELSFKKTKKTIIKNR